MNCLLWALSKVVNVHYSELRQIFDVETIAFPGLPEPYCRRSPHVDEVCDFLLQNNLTCTVIHYCPMLGTPERYSPVYQDHSSRFMSYMAKHDGILIASRHAYAVIDGKFYDSVNRDHTKEQYREFWIIK